MKVLQITTNYPCKENPIFGIFMKEQVESLEPIGIKNTIFFSNGLKAMSKGRHSAKWIHMLSAIKLFFHLMVHRYDVIHCHSVISGLIFYYARGWWFNKNCILSLQNDPTMLNGSDTLYFNMLYPIFKKIIVKMPIHSELSKIEYIPNGVNLDFFKPMDKNQCKTKLGLDKDKRYILFVDSNSNKGRTQKRRDRFDQTLNILRNKYGYNDLEPLVMIGVQRELVPYYINACELHLLSSDQEGSPNSVKECMSCNIPCVTTPVGNVRDLFEGVDGCYYAANFDAEDLAFLCDKVLRNSVATDFQATVRKKRLDSSSIANRLVTLYYSIVK